MKNIILICTAFVGDIILTTPLVHRIKEIYPDSNLIYVTTPEGKDVLKGNPYIDKCIIYDKKRLNSGLFGLVKMASQLREFKPDLTIVPHRYFRSSFLSWLTRAPERVGYSIASGAFFYTKKIPYLKDRHEVERLLSFLPEPSKYLPLELFPSKRDKETVDNFWRNIPLGHKILTIAPGSRWDTKQWPIGYYNELITYFSKQPNISLVLVGGEKEESLPVRETSSTRNLIGKTSILELAEIMHRSDIVLTNDSATVHIASASQTPYIFAIFGATTPSLGFYPWSSNAEVIERVNMNCRPCGKHGSNKCPRAHFACMREITPQEVIERIEFQLQYPAKNFEDYN